MQHKTFDRTLTKKQHLQDKNTVMDCSSQASAKSLLLVDFHSALKWGEMNNFTEQTELRHILRHVHNWKWLYITKVLILTHPQSFC